MFAGSCLFLPTTTNPVHVTFVNTLVNYSAFVFISVWWITAWYLDVLKAKLSQHKRPCARLIQRFPPGEIAIVEILCSRWTLSGFSHPWVDITSSYVRLSSRSCEHTLHNRKGCRHPQCGTMGILIPIALKTSSALSVAYENECLGLLVSMFRQRYKNANLFSL